MTLTPLLAFGAAPAQAAVPVQDDDDIVTACETPDPAAPFTAESWAQKRLNFEKAWPFTNQGEGVTVAVIDTGVDTDHPQLQGIDYNFGEDPAGLELVDNIDDPNVDSDLIRPSQDCGGHGTAAAGIIAAQPIPDFSSVVGVAPKATLMPIRVSFDDTDRPANAVLAQAVDYAVNSGADVINLSFESTSPWPALEMEIEQALAEGVVVVAATGNNGNTEAYPAAYPGVIGVGAIASNGVIAETSGYNAPVSVVAPGVAVPLAYLGDGHTTADGTSFAAPFVSGVAALVVDRFGKDITPAEVKRRIELTADESGHNLPDEKYGWGVVNPYAAVTEVLPTEIGTTQTSKPERVLTSLADEPPPDNTVRNAAIAVTAGGIGAVLLTLGGVAAYRRGRARGWRPGVQQTPAEN